MVRYDMDHPSRGNCLIINNTTFSRQTDLDDRNGSDKDAAQLYNLFDDLSFDVILKKNLTYRDTMKVVRKGINILLLKPFSVE